MTKPHARGLSKVLTTRQLCFPRVMANHFQRTSLNTFSRSSILWVILSQDHIIFGSNWLTTVNMKHCHCYFFSSVPIDDAIDPLSGLIHRRRHHQASATGASIPCPTVRRQMCAPSEGGRVGQLVTSIRLQHFVLHHRKYVPPELTNRKPRIDQSDFPYFFKSTMLVSCYFQDYGVFVALQLLTILR